jgi:hypothetical protein
MYYVCKSCNKFWYNKIEKCLFCHGELKAIEPKKFEVLGSTRVEVPSREHQDVPYFVLLLRDEFGQTHTRKTTKEYKVGDTITPSGAS